MKKADFLKIFFLTVVFVFAPNAFGGQVTYKIGSHSFDVPKNNVPDLSPWGWLKSVAGLDEEVESFIFEFSGDEMGSVIERYISQDGYLSKKVIGAIYHIDSNERERILSSRKFSDIWYAKNGYEDREVTFDEDSGYYFIFEKKGYRGMFYVFSKPPVSDLPGSKDEFFIATCSGSSSGQLKHVSCSRQFLFMSDLMVDFSVSLENLKVQPQVISFLKKSFSEWMQ